MDDQIKILIAEDSSTQRAYLKNLLINEGYDVHAVSNGSQALESAMLFKPDIVITDVIMPGMNGYKLCKTIKEDVELFNTSVILLTVLSEAEDIVNGLECGADNFIIKPYEDSFLLSKMNNIIINRELRKSGVINSGVEYFYNGKKRHFSSDTSQIINLLLSSYEIAVKKNSELHKVNKELNKAFKDIKELQKLVPICSNCKSIRDDDGYWQHIDKYLSDHADIDFTHGVCPACIEKLYPQLTKKTTKR